MAPGTIRDGTLFEVGRPSLPSEGVTRGEVFGKRLAAPKTAAGEIRLLSSLSCTQSQLEKGKLNCRHLPSIQLGGS